jgi:hypothetical protein
MRINLKSQNHVLSINDIAGDLCINLNEQEANLLKNIDTELSTNLINLFILDFTNKYCISRNDFYVLSYELLKDIDSIFANTNQKNYLFELFSTKKILDKKYILCPFYYVKEQTWNLIIIENLYSNLSPEFINANLNLFKNINANEKTKFKFIFFDINGKVNYKEIKTSISIKLEKYYFLLQI